MKESMRKYETVWLTACQKLFLRLSSLAELFRQDVFPQQSKDSAMCNSVVTLIWTVSIKLEVYHEDLKIQTVIQSLKYKSRPCEKNERLSFKYTL